MSLRVLVAEDDPAMQLVIRVSLARAGLQVKTVSNGAEVVERALAEPPDVIVLDWHMPVLDGPAACRRLKSDPVTKGIPVVFLTARSAVDADQMIASLGAVGRLTKPFDPKTIGDQLRALLAN